MSKLCILAIVALLVGCSSAPKVPVDVPLNISPTLLEECPKLQKLQDNASFDDVLEVSKSNIKLYAGCAEQQRKSVEFIKEVAGKK